MVLKVMVHVETSIDESISLQKPPADLRGWHGMTWLQRCHLCSPVFWQMIEDDNWLPLVCKMRLKVPRVMPRGTCENLHNGTNCELCDTSDDHSVFETSRNDRSNEDWPRMRWSVSIWMLKPRRFSCFKWQKVIFETCWWWYQSWS